MADKVRLQPAQANNVQGKILNDAHEAKRIVQVITSDVGNLVNWWHGEASKSFKGEYDAVKPSFDNMVKMIEKYADVLKVSIANQEQTDRDVAASIRRSL